MVTFVFGKMSYKTWRNIFVMDSQSVHDGHRREMNGFMWLYERSALWPRGSENSDAQLRRTQVHQLRHFLTYIPSAADQHGSAGNGWHRSAADLSSKAGVLLLRSL